MRTKSRPNAPLRVAMRLIGLTLIYAIDFIEERGAVIREPAGGRWRGARDLAIFIFYPEGPNAKTIPYFPLVARAPKLGVKGVYVQRATRHQSRLPDPEASRSRSQRPGRRHRGQTGQCIRLRRGVRLEKARSDPGNRELEPVQT